MVLMGLFNTVVNIMKKFTNAFLLEYYVNCHVEIKKLDYRVVFLY